MDAHTPRPPDVSVVLPFRDVEATLGEALESVLSERDLAIEVLAIDDGSRDGSLAVARSFAARDPRVAIASSEGGGLVAALNLGLALAHAPLVARMDGDDVSLPGRLSAQRAFLRTHPHVDVVGTQVEAFPSSAVQDGLRRYVAWQNALLSPSDHEREIFVEAPLCHPSTMMRREALEAVHGYRSGDFPEDYDLWLRLVGTGRRLAKLDTLGLRWRHRDGRATFGDPRYGESKLRALKAEHLAPRLRGEHRALVLWGAGPFGRRFARALEPCGVRFARFIDIDPKKIGRTARGAPITSHEDLEPDTSFVVFAVGSLGARALVREALHAKGFVEGRDFVCAA